MSDKGAKKAGGEQEGDQGAPAPALSILSLDDDPDFREYIREVLASDGHDVRTAHSSRAFFAACEERLPDVVLLDMKMGQESGAEVLAEIRRRWSRLCVIVVTGYPSLEDMRRTFKQDVYDYLAKPFSIEELRRCLASAASSLGLGQRPQDRLRQALGMHIRLARTERGWTLKDLSEASGVSVSQLSSVERGAHMPSLESLLAIAQALDARPSEWLGAAGF
ncbi:MAG: response regulator [Phycisphaerales bacterium]